MFGIELLETKGDYSLIKWGVQYLVVYDFHANVGMWSWSSIFYNLNDAKHSFDKLVA